MAESGAGGLKQALGRLTLSNAVASRSVADSPPDDLIVGNPCIVKPQQANYQIMLRLHDGADLDSDDEQQYRMNHPIM